MDAIGRLWQLSTIQFDFNLPARFGLEYVAEDGTRKQPVMVHRALYGSEERFFGVLIEHYAGAFPVWLSPVQAVMIPIAERHVEYANKVAAQLKAAGVRVHVDGRNEKMNAKIREHAMQKVPFLLVVGDKEAEAGKVNVRTRGNEKTEDMPAVEFVEKIRKLIAEKTPHVMIAMDFLPAPPQPTPEKSPSTARRHPQFAPDAIAPPAQNDRAMCLRPLR